MCVWGSWVGQVFSFLKEGHFGRRKTWVKVKEGPWKYKYALQQVGTIVPCWTKAVKYPPCSQVPLEFAESAQLGQFEKLNLLLFLSIPDSLTLLLNICHVSYVAWQYLANWSRDFPSFPSIIFISGEQKWKLIFFGFFLANCNLCPAKWRSWAGNLALSAVAVHLSSLPSQGQNPFIGRERLTQKERICCRYCSTVYSSKKESLKQMKT